MELGKSHLDTQMSMGLKALPPDRRFESFPFSGASHFGATLFFAHPF